MTWISDLEKSQPVAFAVLLLAAVAMAGLALGGVRVRGVKLGTTGVLFVGLAFGHFGFHLEHGTMDFVREFGLILFVFTIGLQLGPGFFASLRREGLRLNLLAAAVVALGVGATLLISWLVNIDPLAGVGLLSGATTNTPALGAAQQTLETAGRDLNERLALPALAYAVAYPVGISGIIASLLLLRSLFRIDVDAEAAAFAAAQRQGLATLERMSMRVENPNLEGVPVGRVPGKRETGVVISRLQRSGEREVRAATEDTPLHVGDHVLAVGIRANLEQFVRVVGRVSHVNLMHAPGGISFRRMVVTRKQALGKALDELALDHLYGVSVTRIGRGDVEMTAAPDLRLKFGDTLQVVGDEAGLRGAAGEVGDSRKVLNETHFAPIFLGIALGVVAGVLPISLPGLPVPVRLGLAGGPLVLAILLGRLGHWGGLVWHVPLNVNLALREFGITLFLACVGLKAGAQLFATVFTPQGAVWLTAAALITTAPLLIVGCVARRFLKLNYMTISGLLSGSMTDPPALAFASALGRSDGPSVAYATVYPLTMLLRILSAQILVLACLR